MKYFILISLLIAGCGSYLTMGDFSTYVMMTSRHSRNESRELRQRDVCSSTYLQYAYMTDVYRRGCLNEILLDDCEDLAFMIVDYEHRCTSLLDDVQPTWREDTLSCEENSCPPIQ